MSKIVWLASYPKSGNTWMRVFLTNYLRNAEQPVDINELDNAEIASSRHIFDEAVGIASGDLTYEEVNRYRPDAYIHFAESHSETIYCKIHDAYTYLPNGRPLFPTEVTYGAIYIVRNPLDVAVSYSNHTGSEIDMTIQLMGDHRYCLAMDYGGQPLQLPQRLHSWSDHVVSWRDAPNLNRIFVRYEDMMSQPVETFSSVARFLSADTQLDANNMEQICRAIEFSRFDVVRSQEEQHGFQERPFAAKRFFRSGKSGAWRESLTSAQVDRIIADHRTVMRECGYLTPEGEIVC